MIDFKSISAVFIFFTVQGLTLSVSLDPPADLSVAVITILNSLSEGEAGIDLESMNKACKNMNRELKGIAQSSLIASTSVKLFCFHRFRRQCQQSNEFAGKWWQFQSDLVIAAASGFDFSGVSSSLANSRFWFDLGKVFVLEIAEVTFVRRRKNHAAPIICKCSFPQFRALGFFDNDSRFEIEILITHTRHRTGDACCIDTVDQSWWSGNFRVRKAASVRSLVRAPILEIFASFWLYEKTERGFVRRQFRHRQRSVRGIFQSLRMEFVVKGLFLDKFVKLSARETVRWNLHRLRRFKPAVQIRRAWPSQLPNDRIPELVPHFTANKTALFRVDLIFFQ